jgi:hypothetical protein
MATALRPTGILSFAVAACTFCGRLPARQNAMTNALNALVTALVVIRVVL